MRFFGVFVANADELRAGTVEITRLPKRVGVFDQSLDLVDQLKIHRDADVVWFDIVGLRDGRFRGDACFADRHGCEDQLIWIVVAAFVGGKLLYYLEDPGRYIADPSKMFEDIFCDCILMILLWSWTIGMLRSKRGIHLP